jgi:branched-chain amino acid transport system ATP-binding protein
MELADRITVMNNGRILAEGTPDEIRRDAQVQEAYLGA